jgi:hypothetical protein
MPSERQVVAPFGLRFVGPSLPALNALRIQNGRQQMLPQPKLDCRGVETTHHCNRKGKKLASAVVALLAGALMLPNHEALARGDGGFGGGHEGSFGGGGFHGRALGRGFHGGDFGGGGNREGGFRGRGLSHMAGDRKFDHRGQVGDPYWTPCNYYSYGDDSCGAASALSSPSGERP